MLSSFDKTLENDAIKCLEPTPQLQLNFLKEIIHKNDDYFMKNQHELLRLHLKLLCTLDPKEVLLFLTYIL